MAVEPAHDVLVIGAGCAGMRAAIEAFDNGSDVALLSKIHPTRSHSGAAEGGINAALGNASEDNPELHAFDTVKGSDYLADQDAVEILCSEAPGDVFELENWGAVFSRTEDGRIAQRPFGAAGAPRTAYAADITGHVLIQVLYEQVVKRGIRGLRRVLRLEARRGRRPLRRRDRLGPAARAVSCRSRRATTILATGGAGRLYVGTTNAYACTGDGMAMALRAGVALKDMEMMQFHPTTLAPTGVLITEGCRGEGAYLLNTDGERFLKRYAPNAMELASRDVISRAEQTEIDEGRGIDGNVMLDLRHLGAAEDPRAAARDARALDGLRRHRPDLRPDPGAPGRPLPHGRNRHRRLGPHLARGPLRRRRGRLHLRARRQPPRRQRADGDDHVRAPRRPRRRRPRLPPRRGRGARLGARDAEAELAALLDRSERRAAVGDPRRARRDDARELRRLPPRGRDGGAGPDRRRRCATRFEQVVVEDKGEVFNNDLTQALELGFLLELAECMVVAGLARKESRGAHARPDDYPERDDEHFLRHTLVTWEDGRPAARLETGDDHEMAARREDILSGMSPAPASTLSPRPFAAPAGRAGAAARECSAGGARWTSS